MASTEQQHPQRPRTRSMMSFGSGSHKSSNSVPKVDLTESPREKMARRITGKADPSVAMNELQPSMRAMEKNTMAPLRSMQHKDMMGNLITDPDQSNPTRPRLERPLDTIRSFESAIDGSYSRRYSAQPDVQSRRTSYYSAFAQGSRTPGGFSGGFDRQHSRPASQYGDYQHNDRGYPPNGNQYGHQERPERQDRMSRYQVPRNQSDPMLYGNGGTYGGPGPNVGRGVSPARGHWTHPSLPNQSQDTTHTASTSDSYGTDYTNSTGASLHNQAYGEYQQQMQKPLPPAHDPYVQRNGQSYNGVPEDVYVQQMQGVPFNRGYQRQTADAGGPPPPPPPAHGRGTVNPPTNVNTLRKPVRASVQREDSYGTPAAKNDKRKSWLARRFSKKD